MKTPSTLSCIALLMMSLPAAADDHSDGGLAMISAFHQGSQDAGNCASIAVIKLALFSYGFENVFVKTESDAAHAATTYTLRDGKAVTVTDGEVASVTALSHFGLGTSGEILRQANTLYAVMAKRKCDSLRCAHVTAMIDAHDGFLDTNTEENFVWLGLQGLRVAEPRFDFAALHALHAYIVTNAKHAAFAYGDDYDQQGTAVPVERFKANHSSIITGIGHGRDINGAYRLLPLPPSAPAPSP